jgi:hypothetical protein
MFYSGARAPLQVLRSGPLGAQLPGWFEDYNEFAPHKGLRMKSPSEFRSANQ